MIDCIAVPKIYLGSLLHGEYVWDEHLVPLIDDGLRRLGRWLEVVALQVDDGSQWVGAPGCGAGGVVGVEVVLVRGRANGAAKFHMAGQRRRPGVLRARCACRETSRGEEPREGARNAPQFGKQ